LPVVSKSENEGRNSMRRICGVALLLAAAGVAQADVLQLTSVKDNTLYHSTTGALSNGAGEAFFTGKTQQGQIRRGLLAFDLSGLPAGAVITDVSLTLHCSAAAPAGAPTMVSLHRATANWGEGTSFSDPGGLGAPATPGDATWLHTFFDTQFWATAGGDFAGAASGTQNVENPGVYTWTGGGLLADVQAWLANPSTNFGWLMKDGEGVNGSARRFDSRESQIAANRPLLTITYIPTPGVTTVAAAAGLLAARRRRR
jgi:hypothetical protein